MSISVVDVTGYPTRQNVVINLKEKYLKYPVFRPFVHIKNNLLFRFNGFLVGQCLHWGLAATDAIDYKKTASIIITAWNRLLADTTT